MPLTSKLRSDYVELINQQLDTIQIDSFEDFALVQRALQDIIQAMEGYSLPEKYREKMFFIKDFLQFPGDYVEHQQNYSEYQQIIRERITAKVNELQSLNTTQKQSYIQHQQAQRSQTATNQQTMAERRPPQPGSDAHVKTETQWLREQQLLFNQGPHSPNFESNVMISIPRLRRQFDQFLNRSLVVGRSSRGRLVFANVARLAGFNETQIEAIRMHVIDKPGVLNALRNNPSGSCSIYDFKELTAEQIHNIGTIALIDQRCVANLLCGRITIAQLASMDAISLQQAVESDDYPSIGLNAI